MTIDPVGQEGWVLEPWHVFGKWIQNTCLKVTSKWIIKPPVILHIAMETMAHFVPWFTVPLTNGGVPVRNLLQKISKTLEGLIWYSLIFTWSQCLNGWSPIKSAARWAGLWLPWWRLVAADAQRAGELLGLSKQRQFFFGGGGVSGRSARKTAMRWEYHGIWWDIIWEWDQPTILGWFGWMFLEGNSPPFRGTQRLIHTGRRFSDGDSNRIN